LPAHSSVSKVRTVDPWLLGAHRLSLRQAGLVQRMAFYRTSVRARGQQEAHVQQATCASSIVQRPAEVTPVHRVQDLCAFCRLHDRVD
jgi:hypothetical protein